MRVAPLRRSAQPVSSLPAPTWCPLPALAWVLASPRRPATAQRGASRLPPLDAGFFFPLGAASASGSRAFRRLRLRVGHAPRPRASVRRALGLWETLSVGRLKVPQPLPQSLGIAGSLLRGPNLALSLRRTLGGRRAARPRLRRLRRLRAYRALRHGPWGGHDQVAPAVGLGERLLRRLFRSRRQRRGAFAGALMGLGGAPVGGPIRAPNAARSRFCPRQR